MGNAAVLSITRRFTRSGVTHRPSQANEPSPVVDDKGDVTRHANALEQVAQVAHPLLERVGIPGVVRLVGETAPDMVGRDDPV